MADFSAKGLSYRDYSAAVAGIDKIKRVADLPRLLAVFGSSDFLIDKAIKRLRDRWPGMGGGHCISTRVQGLGPDGFGALWEQDSMFEPSALYFLRHCEKASDLGPLLADIPSPKSLRNHLCVIFR